MQTASRVPILTIGLYGLVDLYIDKYIYIYVERFLPRRAYTRFVHVTQAPGYYRLFLPPPVARVLTIHARVVLAAIRARL